MILFTERLKIAEKYKEWLEQNKQVLDCPMSVVTFLEINSLLNEKAVKKFLEEKND